MKQMQKLKNISNVVVVLIVLLILGIVLTFTSPYFLTTNNLINIALQATTNAILACGMTFVILTGGIDLSVGSVLALSGICFAVTTKMGLPVLLALVLSVFLGAFCGMISGLLVTKFNLPAFVATLGMTSIARGVALQVAGGRGISSFGGRLDFIGNGKVFGIPVTIIVMLILYAVCMFILKYTRAGRYTYAIGGNMEATRLSGINTNKYTTIVYVICGFSAGLAGVLLTCKLDSAQPTAGEGYELDAIAATVIGGTSMSGGEGGLAGTLVGALFIAVLNNGLNLLNVSSYIQQMVIGVVIIIAVMIDRVRQK